MIGGRTNDHSRPHPQNPVDGLGHLTAHRIDPVPLVRRPLHNQQRNGQIMEVDDISLIQIAPGNFLNNIARGKGDKPLVPLVEPAQQSVEADELEIDDCENPLLHISAVLAEAADQLLAGVAVQIALDQLLQEAFLQMGKLMLQLGLEGVILPVHVLPALVDQGEFVDAFAGCPAFVAAQHPHQLADGGIDAPGCKPG
ncbi:hypothetical protein D3C75_933850 [compost metagenome]